MVVARCLVLKIYMCVCEYFDENRDLRGTAVNEWQSVATHKSMNESKMTRSPGLICSFREPVADEAIT